MNNQTTELLKQLSQKLGTTSEYLWKILLHQAPVDSTITLIQSFLLLLLPYITYVLHKKFSKEDKDGNSMYYWHDSLGIIMVILAGCSFIALLMVVCSIETIINGYMNPEYWALNKILDTLKSSN